MKRSPLRRTTSLRRTRFRTKPRQLGPDPVYLAVDQRSGLRCEVVLMGLRCDAAQNDHHHTLKPRKRFHSPVYVMGICRPHHDRASSSYTRGRLITLPLGEGRFQCVVITAVNKWVAHATWPDGRGVVRATDGAKA